MEAQRREGPVLFPEAAQLLVAELGRGPPCLSLCVSELPSGPSYRFPLYPKWWPVGLQCGQMGTAQHLLFTPQVYAELFRPFPLLISLLPKKQTTN